MTATAALRRVADLVEPRAPETAERLRHYAARVEAAPDVRRPTLLAALALREQALAHLLPGSSALPSTATPYPLASLEQRARLVLGESPAAISGGLTPHEAHEWLSTRPDWSPGTWLLLARWQASATADSPSAPQGVSDLRIVRWLLATWRDPARRAALLRDRTERGPHGEEIEGSYYDRLDELRRADVRSPRDSVEVVFGRAKGRLLRELERSLRSRGQPLRSAPRWWRSVRCARLLLSAADLAAEGRALSHCVAQYVGYVGRGESVIVGLCVLGQRSTAELDPRTVEVRQHRGSRNDTPPALCARALEVCLRRWTAAAGVA